MDEGVVGVNFGVRNRGEVNVAELCVRFTQTIQSRSNLLATENVAVVTGEKTSESLLVDDRPVVFNVIPPRRYCGPSTM